MATADDQQQLLFPSLPQNSLLNALPRMQSFFNGLGQNAPTLNPQVMGPATPPQITFPPLTAAAPVTPGAGGGPDRVNPPVVPPVTAAARPAAARTPRTATAPAAAPFTPGVDGMVVNGANVPWGTTFGASGDGGIRLPGQGGGAGGYGGGAGGGYGGGLGGMIDPRVAFQQGVGSQFDFGQAAAQAMIEAASSHGDPRNYSYRLAAFAHPFLNGLAGVDMSGVNAANSALAGITEAGIHEKGTEYAANQNLAGRKVEAGAQVQINREATHPMGQTTDMGFGYPVTTTTYGTNVGGKGFVSLDSAKPQPELKPGSVVVDPVTRERRKYLGGNRKDPASYAPE